MKIVLRTRLNGRLPDPQGKYRDEITQEATVELDITDINSYEEHVPKEFDDLVEVAKTRMDILRAGFYKELKRVGGHNYAEV